MESVSLVCTGDYNSLVNALDRDDINSFRSAINSVSEAEKRKIFELACRTPGRAQFIDECISAGCDVNELNAQHKRPINFVLESSTEENLAALLRDPSVDVNAKSYMYKQTPVNSLTEEISDKNFEKVFSCIKLLIKYGADLSVPDRREITPMTNILKNHHLNVSNKEVIVRYFGPPNNIQINEEWDFIRLFFSLKNKKEDEFLEGLAQAETNPNLLQELFTASVGIETLLIVAVREDLIMALERMLQLGADVNQQTSSYLIVPSMARWMSHWTSPWLSPAICACIRGHWRSLETLLKSPKLGVNSAPLLQIILGNFGCKVTEKVDYEKCFELLLNHPNIDVNLQGAYTQNVLHHAAMFHNSKPILELLKKGAYIGGRNAFNEFSISHISANVLESHFDSCITTNGFRSSDDKFEIEFNFKNFVPFHTLQTDDNADEMGVIEYISKSNELKHLTMHPLIASFLSLKWKRLAPFFYINFFLCALFSVTTVTYILVYYNYHEQNSVMRVIIFLLTFCIAAREMYQFTFSPFVYMKSLKNYLECTLVVLVMLILFDVCPDTWRCTFAATSILLIATEIFLLAGSLPFWSFCTHYVILKTVIWSFLKCLLLYAIIPLAFSLSFFTLLHDHVAEPLEESTKGETNDDKADGDFNKFPNLGLSIMKTLVMSTGEFDADSIDFKTNAFNYIVFIIFVFTVTIVLFNLLNGLAVSDTQAIKSQAELTSFISCARVLARYEGVLATRYPTFFKIFPFCAGIDTFKLPKLINRIRVTPNDSNKILIMPDEEISVSWWVHLRFCNRCIRMDSKVVKMAFDVLKKKRKEQHDEEEREKFNKRITKMETTLEKIADRLMMPKERKRKLSQKITKRFIKMETLLKKIAKKMNDRVN
ncbi:transient receptor potential cation channel protein painless-like [Sitodiplosis mosellana]|uniref:transient receptor potential cation channel protein painless-like n=1 Tax=Sitodiplosis mosellana TaxID=263140 RepID=UPI002443CB13|nr:transient receptor potential cation channel protein painless-like [Sitodiplosis mosellana]XP_055307772.1 transient receptor potential cation channel protein painless-like [Sitodiplosis mosellana]